MTIIKKILPNCCGFSLLETLLAIGISTGTALIIFKVLGESQKGQIMVENRDDINQYHREIIGKFTNRSTCTNTLSDGMLKNLKTFPLTQIINEQYNAVLTIPNQVGKISLIELTVANVDKAKNEAEIRATYNHSIAAKTKTSHKNFRVELSFKDNVFEGCVSRGSLGLDPKDACDLVVGSDEKGESYFYNGKCNFAKGACEQSGRVWSEEGLKCNFSAEDIEALRKEICTTLGFTYSPETSMCVPSPALIEAIETLKKKMEK
jgi:hypothetical protein